MSECDRVRTLLSARIDGELSINESQEVDKHILSCAACRQEWESLVEFDNRLSSALTISNLESSNLESKCAKISKQSASSIQLANKQRISSRVVTIAVAVAAMLILALFPFFYEMQTSPTAVSSPTFVAQLVRATGPVRFLRPGAGDWTEALPNAKEFLTAGSRLKTDAGVLCEVQTATKGTIRLNESAEVVFIDSNQLELVTGQLWCLAPMSTSIDVSLRKVSARPPLSIAFACPSSTELQCVAGNSFASCDSVSPNNSMVTITMGSIACSVAPGETVSIDDEQNIERDLNVDSTAKIWQLPLLAIGTEIDKELVLLLDRLLAPIGMTKSRNMSESQIRMLGPRGAIPLLAYVVAETSPEQLQLRRTAVRLASESADISSVRLLKLLTSDSDEYIASVAKETLNRIDPQIP